MSLKITNYNLTISDVSDNSKNTSKTTQKSQTTSTKSFDDVLVLNQSALKAMTIDAMVKESATGSINPDSVNAAAIMKFRSTLTNVVAPIPKDDVNLLSPNTDKHTINNNASANNTTNNNTSVNNTISNNNTDNTSSTNNNNTDNTTSASNTTNNNTTNNANNTTSVNNASTDIYNSGKLKCSDELNTYFKEAAEIYNVDAKFLKAIAKAESNFDPSATSRSGAMGIMQMMPATAKENGVTNAYDAKDCIMGGARLISKLLTKYNGDKSLALAAYNAGSNNVAKYGGIPPFKETQNYVKKVLEYYNL